VQTRAHLPSHTPGQTLHSTHILDEGELVPGNGVAAAELGVDLEAEVGQVLDLGCVNVLQQNALVVFEKPVAVR